MKKSKFFLKKIDGRFEGIELVPYDNQLSYQSWWLVQGRENFAGNGGKIKKKDMRRKIQSLRRDGLKRVDRRRFLEALAL